MFEHLGLMSMKYRIFTLYPDLEVACNSALLFIGTNFPGQAEPLVYEMVKDAFSGYKAAENTQLNPRHEFIIALCSRAHYLYKIRYCSGKNNIEAVWKPMVEEITTFEKKHASFRILNEPDPQHVNAETASKQFAARILPGHLYAEVFIERDIHAAVH